MTTSTGRLAGLGEMLRYYLERHRPTRIVERIELRICWRQRKDGATTQSETWMESFEYTSTAGFFDLPSAPSCVWSHEAIRELGHLRDERYAPREALLLVSAHAERRCMEDGGALVLASDVAEAALRVAAFWRFTADQRHTSEWWAFTLLHEQDVAERLARAEHWIDIRADLDLV